MGFNFQPQLEGALVSIRPLVAADFSALRAIAADPDLWAQHPVPELAQGDVFTANLDDALSDEGGLTIIDKRSCEIVGFSRYSQRFSGPEAVEIGWTMLSRKCWGGAYNGDVKTLMLNHALSAFPSVMFRVGEDNWRSRKALEKLGARLNGWGQDVESFGRVAKRLGYTINRDMWGR